MRSHTNPTPDTLATGLVRMSPDKRHAALQEKKYRRPKVVAAILFETRKLLGEDAQEAGDLASGVLELIRVLEKDGTAHEVSRLEAQAVLHSSQSQLDEALQKIEEANDLCFDREKRSGLLYASATDR